MRVSPNDSSSPPQDSPPALPEPPDDDSGEAFLAGYRDRIMYLMSYVVTFLITPFSINNFLQGRLWLGISVFAVVAAFAANGVSIRYRRAPLFPYPFLLIPVTGAIGLSLANQGVYGALWCYPGVLLCFFVLSRPMAIATSIALLLLAAPLVYVTLDPPVAIRFAASMALTIAIIVVITDVIRKLQSELIDQAITDPLTGAFNRRQMVASLNDAIERNRRAQAPSAVLLIDIDHFKRVNDDLGHHTGDRVLKDLVKLVAARIRKTDKLFRMGGEEFLVLLPDTTAASAMIQAESLRGRVAESGILKNRPVTVSIGVSEYQKGQSQDEWVKAADAALYRAKESGRNRVMNADIAPAAVSAPA